LGRLYIPAGILFRRPKKGETAHVIRGRDLGGPGGSLIMPDGSDGNTEGYVPAWLDDDNCGVYSTDETVHVESKNKDVVINAGGATIHITKDGAISIDAKNGQKLSLQGGGKAIARKDDQVKCYVPANSFVISVSGGGTSPVAATMNATPIECTGTVTAASTKAECG
jgi:hypothetical protein